MAGLAALHFGCTVPAREVMELGHGEMRQKERKRENTLLVSCAARVASRLPWNSAHGSIRPTSPRLRLEALSLWTSMCSGGSVRVTLYFESVRELGPCERWCRGGWVK